MALASGKRKPEATPIVAPALAAAVTSNIGKRASQEDRYALINDVWSEVSVPAADLPPCRFFGVFDGHVSDAAAELASTLLWSKLQTSLVGLMGDTAHSVLPSSGAIELAMRDAFAATDKHVCEVAGTSGTTATCALQLGDTLCVANLGDSRTVLCRAERH